MKDNLGKNCGHGQKWHSTILLCLGHGAEGMIMEGLFSIRDRRQDHILSSLNKQLTISGIIN